MNRTLLRRVASPGVPSLSLSLGIVVGLSLVSRGAPTEASRESSLGSGPSRTIVSCTFRRPTGRAAKPVPSPGAPCRGRRRYAPPGRVRILGAEHPRETCPSCPSCPSFACTRAATAMPVRSVGHKHPYAVDVGPHSNFGERQLVYRSGDVVIPRVETHEPLSLELKDFARDQDRRGASLQRHARAGHRR